MAAKGDPCDLSASEGSTDSDESASDAARVESKLYRDAITECTPDIVDVLRNETGILSLAMSVGLISDHSYNEFLKQESSNQAEQFLLKIKSKIKVTPSSYNKFLKILREEKATEDLANMIEDKVKKLKQLPTTRRVKKVKKKGGNNKASEMPKLDTYEAYSSGFLSDFSKSQAGDAFPPTKSLSSGAMGGASVYCSSDGNEPDRADSTEVITIRPHQETASLSSSVILSSVQENRPVQNGEKTSLEESGADISLPVYPSQNYLANIFEDLRLGVELGKTKAEKVVSDREDKISNLLQKLRAMYAEIERLRKEIDKRERDYKELEIEKQEEINSLRKQYDEEHHCAVARSDRDRKKIEELEQKLVEAQDEKKRKEEELLADIVQRDEDIETLKKSHNSEVKQSTDRLEVERQQTQKLEQHLQKATNEKIALEKKRDELTLKLAELRLKNSEEISAIKETMYKLKEDAQARTFEAEKQAMTERTQKIKAEMQAQLDIKDAQQAAQLSIKDAQIMHKTENEARLLEALQEQAQRFDREITSLRAVHVQRLVSSSGLGNQEHLSVSLMQASVTQMSCSNSNQSEDNSKQQTQSED